jgi:hypothetical protein
MRNFRLTAAYVSSYHLLEERNSDDDGRPFAAFLPLDVHPTRQQRDAIQASAFARIRELRAFLPFGEGVPFFIAGPSLSPDRHVGA